MNLRIPLALLVSLSFSACDRGPLDALRPDRADLAVTPTAALDGVTVLDFQAHLWGLNDRGDIVAVRPDGVSILWADGVTTELPPLPGYTRTTAWTVNDDRQVVGVLEGPGKYDAFVWENGSYTLLGPGSAETITDADPPLIAGSVGDHAGVWEHDGSTWASTILDVDGAIWGAMFGANSRGDVTGSYQVAGGLFGAVWTRTADGWALQQIDPLGYQGVISNAINDAGQVSGWLQNPQQPSLAFLWEAGVTTILPPLAGHTRSFAYMLNEVGDVAGASDNDPIFWRDGVPILLPEPDGATFCHLVRINDAGRAAGNCDFADGRYPVIWELDAVGLGATAAQVDLFEAIGEIENAGVANSLRSKVSTAQAAAERENRTAAVNVLGAFSSQVRAQTGKHISEPAAASLLASARVAVDRLSE